MSAVLMNPKTHFKDLKRTIIDEALLVLVNIVVIPHSGWNPKGAGGDHQWKTLLKNATGILRYSIQ